MRLPPTPPLQMIIKEVIWLLKPSVKQSIGEVLNFLLKYQILLHFQCLSSVLHHGLLVGLLASSFAAPFQWDTTV